MSKVILNTNTELRRFPGLIGIYTYYIEFDKNLIFIVSNSNRIINNILISQGELGYTNNEWNDTYFILNEKGELIVVSNEANKFSINESGELEYTDMTETRNLGQVSAFISGTVPPTNTSLIWYDTNEGVYLQKYWNVQTGDWTAFTVGVNSDIMYRQDIAAISGISTVSFRSDLPSTDYAVEILSFISSGGTPVLSGWNIPEVNKTLSGFQIIPPTRYPDGNIVYRASLYV